MAIKAAKSLKAKVEKAKREEKKYMTEGKERYEKRRRLGFD